MQFFQITTKTTLPKELLYFYSNYYHYYFYFYFYFYYYYYYYYYYYFYVICCRAAMHTALHLRTYKVDSKSGWAHCMSGHTLFPISPLRNTVRLKAHLTLQHKHEENVLFLTRDNDTIGRPNFFS